MAVDKGNEVWEVIGTTTTNSTRDSVHKPTVDYKWLWSLAQQEALRRVSTKNADGIYVLHRDPEMRAKRIAGAYADLYIRSKDASKGKLQMYWVGLAAFVVKDIYYAFKYTRDELFNGGLVPDGKDIGSTIMLKGGAYEHGMRTYEALAKGNLWLFMDIYPWLWLVLQWGLNDDGSVNAAFIKAAAKARDSSTFQEQSKLAVDWLPFGKNWLGSCKGFIETDKIQAEANATLSQIKSEEDVTSFKYLANHQIRDHLPKEAPTPFRMPPSRYWINFQNALSVLNAYHDETLRVCNDGAAIGRLEKIKHFTATGEIDEAYGQLIAQVASATRNDKVGIFKSQQAELVAIAKHEQLNVLQPVIYDDPMLKKSLDLNHSYSRRFTDVVTPYLQLVFSATQNSSDPTNFVRFDPPAGFVDWLTGPNKSLANKEDRMGYVNDIAKVFNKKMQTKRAYMEDQIRTISGWYL